MLKVIRDGRNNKYEISCDGVPDGKLNIEVGTQSTPEFIKLLQQLVGLNEYKLSTIYTAVRKHGDIIPC